MQFAGYFKRFQERLLPKVRAELKKNYGFQNRVFWRGHNYWSKQQLEIVLFYSIEYFSNISCMNAKLVKLNYIAPTPII